MAASYQPDREDSDGGIIAEINITPLTDVFLVLLVIFMVTTSVIQNQGKNIDLPGADVVDETPQGVTVSVGADGEMMINDAIVPEDRLFEVLESALADAREKIVVLRGDRAVLLGQAVNILDVAQQAGARGIALATKPNPKDKDLGG
ncbi:MAG TPA: biopolymer transporter ExbD [Myxococcota bacterium]|nr:biopolymer transporter ExbD [Myxococcota bacterium]